MPPKAISAATGSVSKSAPTANSAATGSVAKSAPTTPEQMRAVMNWLAVENNRLACFGGAGAKSAYGGKCVVKPSTAYNQLAQVVNAKFDRTNRVGNSNTNKKPCWKLQHEMEFHTNSNTNFHRELMWVVTLPNTFLKKSQHPFFQHMLASTPPTRLFIRNDMGQ